MARSNSGSEMSGFHKTITNELKALPGKLIRQKLIALIAQKAPDAPTDLAMALAEHVLSDAEGEFEFDTADEHEIDVEFTAADAEKIAADVRAFVRNDVPELVSKIIGDAARVILKTLHRDWPGQRDWQLETREAFRERLEERWGPGFDILRMMYTIAAEVGGEADRRQRRSRAKRNRVLNDTLMRLHVRACQVVAEILCLMENGFADGAIGRWRTLHEITVVAAVIAHFGEDLAVRYRAHESVEAKRAMDRYQVSHSLLGYAPLTPKEIAQVEKDYADVLSLYGDKFGSEYGWARDHLNHKKPRFLDLEVAAGKLDMRAFYGMASDNIHAGPKGITSRLGLLRGPGEPSGLAGASNVGFIDPAQNTAFDLTLVTSLILRSANLDDMIQLKVLILLRDQIAGKLQAADRRIKKEHRALLRAR